jgi:hypothetical protein
VRPSHDIVDILRAAAAMTGDLTPAETSQLFQDAAQMIETLRALVNVQNELLEDGTWAGSS